MTTVGGNLENKTIGLQFGVSGVFADCEYVGGKVQLKAISTDSAGNNIYAPQGTWTSAIIDIGDNFKDYGKLFASEVKQGDSSIKLETRTSDDGITFDEWQTVASDGTINSTKRRRIQVRVTFYVAYDDANIYISKGNNADDAKNVFNNDFIDTSNGITLKRDYELEMTKDSSWSDTGELHKKAINKDDWYKINKVNVLPSEKLSKTLILSQNEYKTYNSGWQTVSSTPPSESQYLSDGIDDLTVLERKVQSIPPIKMDKSEILLQNGKVFAKTIDLKKYMDIRSIKVEVK